LLSNLGQRLRDACICCGGYGRLLSTVSASSVSLSVEILLGGRADDSGRPPADDSESERDERRLRPTSRDQYWYQLEAKAP